MPSTELILHLTRTFASVSTTTLGTAITGQTVGPSQLGGLFYEPLPVPRDYDRSRPGYLYAALANTGIVGPPTGAVVIQSTRTLAPPPGPPSNLTLSQTFTPPANWDASNWLLLELLNAGGPYFPASSIADQSLLGIRISRDGPNAADTWTATLTILEFAVLRYNRLCHICTLC